MSGCGLGTHMLDHTCGRADCEYCNPAMEGRTGPSTVEVRGFAHHDPLDEPFDAAVAEAGGEDALRTEYERVSANAAARGVYGGERYLNQPNYDEPPFLVQLAADVWATIRDTVRGLRFELASWIAPEPCRVVMGPPNATVEYRCEECGHTGYTQRRFSTRMILRRHDIEMFRVQPDQWPTSLAGLLDLLESTVAEAVWHVAAGDTLEDSLNAQHLYAECEAIRRMIYRKHAAAP